MDGFNRPALLSLDSPIEEDVRVTEHYDVLVHGTDNYDEDGNLIGKVVLFV